ncbi:MAG TPA: glycosyltransferase family 4 protein [Gemmatimonadaceae bacterium]|nr:glycosyltransferase family 4 protein [Gemmatimonadaceae bacterium]
MRILLLTPSPPAPSANSAVPVVAWAQLRALAGRHELSVATTAGPDPTELDAVERLRAEGIDVHVVVRRDAAMLERLVRCVRNAVRWLILRRPMYVVWYQEPALQRMLDALLSERRIDVVHVNDSAMATYALRTTAPKLLVEIEARAPRPIDWTGWLRGSWYRGIMDEADWQRWPRHQRNAWRGFDRIEVFTRRDAGTVSRIAPDVSSRVHVNPFGIEMPSVADPSLQEEGTIAFVGNYTHAPNVDAARWLANTLMPLLRARHPGARLHLYGIDPRGALAGIAREDVRVHGWLRDIEPAIARAAVILAPVRVGGGQRMKVLQAMAMGKAVVTTPRGADGIVIDGGDPPVAIGDLAEEIAERTAELLRDPGRRHALGARARAVAQDHHDLRAYGARLDAAYAALLDAQRGATEHASAP